MISGALPVAAADLAPPVPAPPVLVQTAPDWTGFYVGGHMGIAGTFASYDYSTLFSGSLNNHTRIGRINGAAPGVYGGFNYQIASFVIGIESDATFTNGMFRLNGPNNDALQFSNTAYGVAARAGYLVTPDTMVYGKLGYTRIQLSGTQNLPPVPFKQTVAASQAGVGVEHLITDNIAFRVEGTYTSANNDLVLNQGFDHYRPSLLQVTAGVSYKYDPLPRTTYVSPIDVSNRLITHEPSWTSIYGGGLIGIGIGQVTRYDSTFGLIGPYAALRFAGGALAGGDIQLGRYFVVGAAIDTQWMHATFDDDVGVGLNGAFHRFAHIDRVSAVTGRVGVLLSPTVLVYGKGGPAQIRFAPEQSYFAAILPAVRTSAQNLPAVQGGLGMETLLADHVALRVEGLYTRATRSIVINGLVPGMTTIQPSTLTASVGLVVKY